MYWTNRFWIANSEPASCRLVAATIFRAKLFYHVERRTCFVCEFPVAVDWQITVNTAQHVDQIAERLFLTFEHRVGGFAIFDAARVGDANGRFVLPFCVCAGSPNRAANVPVSGQVNEEMVTHVRPFAAVNVQTAQPFNVDVVVRLGGRTMKYNLSRYHSTLFLANNSLIS